MSSNTLKAGFFALIMQGFFMIAIFMGFLLDPLLGLWVAGFYFFVVGSLLMFSFFLKLERKLSLT